MEKHSDLFVLLIRLKSYLISLIDSPEECNDSLEYTEEYLNRKFPESASEILDLLKSSEILSDCQIVFDANIQEKFKNIADKEIGLVGLEKLLDTYQIDGTELLVKDKWNKDIKHEREERIRQIISILLKISNEWINRKNIDDDIEDLSMLIEEEVLRADEIQKLNAVSQETGISYSKLSTLTLIYLKFFVDYLFDNGGDVSLKNFQEKLNRIIRNIESKYNDLLRQNGMKE